MVEVWGRSLTNSDDNVIMGRTTTIQSKKSVGFCLPFSLDAGYLEYIG